MRSSHIVALSVACSALAALGCVRDDDYEAAEASVTAALETSRSSGTSGVAFETSDKNGCVDPVRAAQSAAGLPMVGLYPEGCAVKTQDGARVHVQFHDCTGPFGRMHLNGGVDAVFTGCEDAKAHVEVQDSGDLTRNGRAMDYQATAVITEQSAGRDVAWNAAWNSTTRRGRHVEHTSDLDVVIDGSTNCRTISGTTEGHVDQVRFGSEIQWLTVCPDKCPSAGTLRVHRETRRGEKILEVRFNGTDRAEVTASNGRTFQVQMVCVDE